jgi:hypothetical protein
MAGLADDVFVEATRAFTVWLVPPLTQLRKHVGIAARQTASRLRSNLQGSIRLAPSVRV